MKGTNDYGMDIWSDGNFIIKNNLVALADKSQPALLEIIARLRDEYKQEGPLLLRFPHLIKKQLDSMFGAFSNARSEFAYEGSFKAVFPLKVNQYPGFVRNLVQAAKPYDYGLEAGSKAEILLAMAYNKLGAPITVNGFKDKDLLNMGFIAANMGHNITLTIEGINELEMIIAIAKERGESSLRPKIGLRIRLHSLGSGAWAKSGGINSKFGLNSTELIEALELLKKNDLLELFHMVHFHIGSQITEIRPLKKALQEAGNIYAELRKMGASNLSSINLGGGLAVEYSQFKSEGPNYTLSEYANDIVFTLKTIAEQKNSPQPNIYIESGRFISAPHAVLVAPVLELFSQEYSECKLVKKPQNPQLIDELLDLHANINEQNALEYLHDANSHLESVLTLFDLGYVDLADRSNAEILAHLISEKALSLLSSNQKRLLQSQIQERYLVNFSLFQSLPDFWGLGQSFPIMPLDRLNERATLSACIWDITCDSDGEIPFKPSKNPLMLHDVDVEKEDYFLGFFLVGAYQEVLGMKHNLFTHPTQVCVTLNDSGFEIENIIEAQSVLDTLEDLDYDPKALWDALMKRMEHLGNKAQLSYELTRFANTNGYLRPS